MNLTKAFAGLIIALSLSASANANFVFTNYMTEGDKNAVIDTETNLTWANLGVTRGMSYNAVLESTLNGSLYGWRIATVDEVTTMFDNFFDYANWASTVSMTYRDNTAEAWIEVKDFAYTFGNYGQRDVNPAYGYFKDGDSVYSAGAYTNDGSYAYLKTLGAKNVVNTSVASEFYGTFLVSGTANIDEQNDMTDVPVPVTLSGPCFCLA